MVILIGGETHTGKTRLAQSILEKYHIPYTSLDHIKMGLIRGLTDCPFSSLDSDTKIADRLWPIAKGMIDTCIENGQNIILEGCYLPPNQVCQLNREQVLPLYLIFSSAYIENHFNLIMDYENVIEKRLYPSDLQKEEYLRANRSLREQCMNANIPFVEIDSDYLQSMQEIDFYLQENLIKLRRYNSSDLEEIASLFYDTVHTVCKRDYSVNQLNAWATGSIDDKSWDFSLLNHYSIVAEFGNRIVGFGDVDGNYIDRLYVHKDFQSLGIGTRIVHALEEYAQDSFDEKGCYITHASITAKPFFESLGYHVKKEQQVERHEEILTNFIMCKGPSVNTEF